MNSFRVLLLGILLLVATVNLAEAHKDSKHTTQWAPEICKAGILSRSCSVCCDVACGQCGGKGCRDRSEKTGKECCSKKLSDEGNVCVQEDDINCVVKDSECPCEDDALCIKKEKLSSITFIYTGGDCSQSTNDQEGKARCSDSARLDDEVYVKFSNGKSSKSSKHSKDSAEMKVSLGGTVTVGDLKSETSYQIYNYPQEVGQVGAIHTSCSKPLSLGDVFGALTVVKFEYKNGKVVKRCPQTPRPPPALPFRICKRGILSNSCHACCDKRCGQCGGDECGVASETTGLDCCSKGIKKTGVVCENKRDVGCINPFGKCPPPPPPPTPPTPPCDKIECRTKPTTIFYQYTAAGCASSDNSQGEKTDCDESGGGLMGEVQVTIGSGKKDGQIEDGETFTVEAGFLIESNPSKMPSNTGYTVVSGTNAVQSGYFHTSCSKPLFLGDIFGALTVVGFAYDKLPPDVCDVEPPEPPVTCPANGDCMCSRGVLNERKSICCPEHCETCGGDRCKPGCCTGSIKRSGRHCSEREAPCVMD